MKRICYISLSLINENLSNLVLANGKKRKILRNAEMGTVIEFSNYYRSRRHSTFNNIFNKIVNSLIWNRKNELILHLATFFITKTQLQDRNQFLDRLSDNFKVHLFYWIITWNRRQPEKGTQVWTWETQKGQKTLPLCKSIGQHGSLSRSSMFKSCKKSLTEWKKSPMFVKVLQADPIDDETDDPGQFVPLGELTPPGIMALN